MANYNARGVPLQTFDAQAKAATDLPGPSGSAADALKGPIDQFQHLSNYLSSWADEAAKAEGADAGTTAALQQGDNLALRKDGTLTGAAFDKAAIDTRSAQLDTAVRNDLFTQSQKFEGDPAGMKAAFDQVNAAYTEKAGLSPELQAHFDKRFADLRFAYEKQAIETRDAKVKANAAASYGTAIDTAVKDAQRTAYILANDPEADGKIAAESGRIKRMVAHAAEAGYITPANAQSMLGSIDDNLALQKIQGTFEKLTGVDAKTQFIDQMKTDWRDGKVLKKLGPDEFGKVVNSLTTQVNKETSLQNQQARTLQAGVDSIRSRVVEGYRVPDAEWGELDAVAQRSNSPQLQARLAAGKAEAAMVQNWWSMKPAELGAAIQADRARVAVKGATERDQSRLDTAEKVYTTMTKEAKDDPIGLAERTGRAAPTSLSPAMIDGNPDAISGYFAQRKAAAEHAASEYGVTPKYFLPEESEAWAKVMNEGGGNALAVAMLFRQQWDAPTARAAIREIAPKATLMAHAADVVVGGGSVDFARDVARALEIRGMDKFKPVDVKKADLEHLVQDTYGTALSQASGTVQDTAIAAARAAFTARSRSQDVPSDLTAGKGRDLMQRSLQEAVGARFVDGTQYGGVANVSRGWFSGGYKVAVPSEIRADKFGDVIAAITDADINPASGMPNNGLIEAGNIDLHSRPRVEGADGSISTVRSMSTNIDGKEVLIPTVSDDGKILSAADAIENFQKTGKHLGKFDTPENATAYALALHRAQEAEYLGNGPPQTADGKPYSARDIRAGKFVAVPGGYRIALGDDLASDPRFIRGADGKPFVLDLAAMADTLHRRVPGAYLARP